MFKMYRKYIYIIEIESWGGLDYYSVSVFSSLFIVTEIIEIGNEFISGAIYMFFPSKMKNKIQKCNN